jgi:uncharacterized membrane protein
LFSAKLIYMDFNIFLELISNNLFKLFCHQDPSRLMHMGVHQVMLCPRCIGLHAGFFISLVYSLTENHKRNKFSGIIPLTICISGILLNLMEWSFSQLAITTSASISRLFTGAFAGSCMSILALVYTRNFIHGSAQGYKFTTVLFWVSFASPLPVFQ